MNKNRIITGLDIGTSKVSAVAASIAKDGQFSIVGHATQDSRGVSRGAITDLNETVHSVSGVLKKLISKVPGAPGQIYVNISGETLKGSRSKGMIPLSLRGREIAKPDITRCIDAASTVHLPFDREIVHRIVQRFSVDDQPWIKKPFGLYASRLACEVYIITAGVNAIQNIFKCVSNAGYDVKEVVYTGIADGAAVLNKEELESGVVLVSMGAGLTHISVFSEGALCEIAIMRSGTLDLKDDFRTSAQLSEVITNVALKLQGSKETPASPKSVVVTGGIVFYDGVIEYLEEKLACPVRMGVAKEVRGEISGLDSIRLCTAIGLAKYAAEKGDIAPRSVKNMAESLSLKVADIFNNYF